MCNNITRARKKLAIRPPDAHAARATRYNVKPLPRRAARGQPQVLTPRATRPGAWALARASRATTQAPGSGAAGSRAWWVRGVEKPAWVEPPLPALTAAEGVGRTRRPARGQGVFHTKFGEGVLLTLEGSGTDAARKVNFGRHGVSGWRCRWRSFSRSIRFVRLRPLPIPQHLVRRNLAL